MYKQVDSTQLFMEVRYPEKLGDDHKTVAMIFFFGGGWNSGSIRQLEPQAKYFAQRGITCFLVDYRVKKRQKTSPFESLKDAKSAIRYVKKHADDFGIDSARVIAAGASAGGHLAAATAMIEGYDECSDDLSVSCVPDALVLFNPVIDNGPGGYGYERIGDHYKDFSPLHNIKKGAPPTILFFGTKDRFVPVETAKYYQKVMQKVNSICELYIYEGQEHGFFNYKNFEYYKETVTKTDEFLQTLGYLNKEPIIEIK
ncbi:alpha/beta hydrolase [Saccharicrinis fermentans]|nr:alpha/beta hydrolase [Saccharicrinis fermentans]